LLEGSCHWFGITPQMRNAWFPNRADLLMGVPEVHLLVLLSSHISMIEDTSPRVCCLKCRKSESRTFWL